MEHFLTNPRIIFFTISIIGFVSYKYFKPKQDTQHIDDDMKNIREFEQYNKHIIDKLIKDIIAIKSEDNMTNIEKIVQLQINIRKQIDNFKLYLPVNEDLIIHKWDVIAKRIINDVQSVVKNHRSL